MTFIMRLSLDLRCKSNFLPRQTARWRVTTLEALKVDFFTASDLLTFESPFDMRCGWPVTFNNQLLSLQIGF